MSLIFFYQLALIVLGLALLIKGANIVVDSSSMLSRKWGIPEWFTGFTIIALGTSLPELSSNLYSAYLGHDDFIVGNVLGSNMFNLLFILGIGSLMFKVNIEIKTLKSDWLFSLILTVLLFILCFGYVLLPQNNGNLSRLDGYILLFIVLLYLSVILFAKKSLLSSGFQPAKRMNKDSIWNSISLIGGLVGLALGSKLAVDGMMTMGGLIGFPQDMTAIILLAGGTSLPELSACITAFRKNKSQMAIGSILGSNILNIGVVLGLSIIVHPVTVIESFVTDIYFLFAGTAFPLVGLLALAYFTKQKQEIQLPIPLGTMMLAFYITYLAIYLSQFLG